MPSVMTRLALATLNKQFGDEVDTIKKREIGQQKKK